jgi:hypothetical protein
MRIKNLNFLRILTFVGIFSLLFYYYLAWSTMLTEPYARTGSDFMGFYSYGRVSQTKGFEHIYDIEEQKRIQEEIVGHPVIVRFHTHLPYIAPLAAAVVDTDYVESFKRWAVILLLLNSLNVYVLVKVLNINGLSKENLFVLCAGAFLFDPTFSGFMNGQDTEILLLGAALWTFGMFSGKYYLAGLGLSLTTIRPQIALFLAIPFFFHHQRVFWGFAIGSVILAAISLGLLGIDGSVKFVESIRYIESTVWRESHALDMPTISGLIRRNFEITNVGLVSNFVWLIYLAGIIGFCVWWWKSDVIDERHIGLLSIAGILLLPYAHYHDLILLLIPIFCILRVFEKRASLTRGYLVVGPLAISWVLNLGFAGDGSLKFPIVYGVMLTLAWLLIAPDHFIKDAPGASSV